jgi:DNA polymerase bacteriophage-type
VIHFDVESFSEVNLFSAGQWRYWEDESTEVLCLAYCVDEGKVWRWWPGATHPPLALFDAIARGHKLVAWNAQFERLAWRWLRKRFNFPVVTDDRWQCAAAQAAALALPRSLENAGFAVGVQEQKDPEGRRLIRKFCIPQRNGRRIYPEDDPEDFEKLMLYCMQDVRSERSICHVLPPLCEAEEKVWQLDTKINDRGIPLDRNLINRMAKVSGALAKDLHKRVVDITGGIKPSQRDVLFKWCNDRGADLDALRANLVRARLRDGDLDDNVRTVLQLRLEAARVSVKKLNSALACIGAGDRLRGMLLYHGATTGRWSGKLVQPHNFPRGVLKLAMYQLVIELVLKENVDAFRLLFESPMEALSSVMRAIITASEGKTFVIADYSAIEARVLVWLAGQDDILALYTADQDLYVFMASRIYKVKPEDVSEEQRKFGKDTVLGCGYQMGVEKFLRTCLDRGLTIDRKLAELCVYGYRETYTRVVRMWRDVETAAVLAVQKKTKTHVARCSFHVEGRFLYCTLPSGRRLAYPDPEIHYDEDFDKAALTFMGEVKKKWVRQRTYGGKLVENIVQAISRDIMAHGMHNAESNGMPVVGTVHDEVLTEVDDDGLGNVKDVKRLERLLCTLPQWAKGCPIAAKGFATKRYRKG